MRNDEMSNVYDEERQRKGYPKHDEDKPSSLPPPCQLEDTDVLAQASRRSNEQPNDSTNQAHYAGA